MSNPTYWGIQALSMRFTMKTRVKFGLLPRHWEYYANNHAQAVMDACKAADKAKLAYC